jgi:hypothetical protein
VLSIALQLTLLASLPLPPASEGDLHLRPPQALLVDIPQERFVHAPPVPLAELSKKDAWLAEKNRRFNVHLDDEALAQVARGRNRRRSTGEGAPSPATRVLPLTTLFNLRTRETLAILPGQPPEERLHTFLRDHHTNQATQMDERLVDVLCRVAKRFSAERVDVVSGYRSPKYNLMLRKKGREVARQSQHTEGNAVDFRVRGVPTRRLLQFVKSLRAGGVGYYPHSQFVHSDTGKVRFWRGS